MGNIKGSSLYQFNGLAYELDNLDFVVKTIFESESLSGDNVTDDTNNDKSIENQYCENNFISTRKRPILTIYLPIKENGRSSLGVSKNLADRRLYNLWNNLNRNSTVADLYNTFMEEYLSLNHMKKIQIQINLTLIIKRRNSSFSKIYFQLRVDLQFMNMFSVQT